MARFPLATRARRVPNLHSPGGCQICICQCYHICLRGALGCPKHSRGKLILTGPFAQSKSGRLTDHAAKAKSNCPDQLTCLRLASIALTSRGRQFQARQHNNHALNHATSLPSRIYL